MNPTEPMIPKAIAYIRVSIQRQDKSGFGIRAQREAIAQFIASEGMELLGEYVEIETDNGADAPDRRLVLRDALAHAKKAKGIAVVVAKLDRLSSDVCQRRCIHVASVTAKLIRRSPPHDW